MTMYFVSDIHGQYLALQKALREVSFSPESGDQLYVLGDLVDRGPHSREVLLELLGMQQSYPNQVILLKGNHEQMLQDWLLRQGNPEMYLRFNGGDATIRSLLHDHPLRRAFLSSMPSGEVQEEARNLILARYPQLLSALSSLPLYVDLPHGRSNGAPPVLLVHAGIRPGLPLNRQKPDDLLWIREPFYNHYNGELGVVFGHTPVNRLPGYTGNGPWQRNNIVGIDGGAAYHRLLLLLEWPTMRSLSIPIRDLGRSVSVRLS
ncbi:metallophosphoesterase family protein [Brevibacillus sp. TJ4]|uniref:metallophosphoesterase family protein n=1 Tax=Brevibacillus sp. TJ4 TaxID=3234853 RepID=UPI0037D5781E